MTTNTHTSDLSLRWTMRAVGLLLAAACAYLLTRDMVRTGEAITFLSIGIGLGFVTFVSSWFSQAAVPQPERVRS